MRPDDGTDRLSRRSLLLSALSGAALSVAVALGCAAPPAAARQQQDKSGGSVGKGKKTMSDTTTNTATTAPAGREIATFAGGCFWCTEAVFTELKGVDKVVSGYSGGTVPNPTYEQVCGGDTGHAEAIQITFDPKVISYADLLHIFFTTHDPTTLNRQGADVGTQYRSAIFYHNEAQKSAVEKVIKEITADKLYPNPIVTEVTAFKNWYPAENYHQDYYARNPNQGYCSFVIAPKVAKFRAKYRNLLKKQ